MKDNGGAIMNKKLKPEPVALDRIDLEKRVRDRGLYSTARKLNEALRELGDEIIRKGAKR